MTSLPLPLPPGDPRQVRALEAAARNRYEEIREMPGMREHWPPWEEAHPDMRETYQAVVAGWMKATVSALQTEGVVLVAAPPCKACEGTGKVPLVDEALHLPRQSMKSGHSLSPHYGELSCPRCKGSGLARMVALDDVVHWANSTLDIKVGRAIDRRFSGELP